MAIETIGKSASLAVLRGTEVVRAVVVGDASAGASARPAARLAADLDTTLRWCDDEGIELSFVSVAVGPGSFTGLRVGVTTAKVLAFAKGWPLVAVDSLSAMASSYFAENPGSAGVLVGINAYRAMVYAAIHHTVAADDATEILSSSRWQELVSGSAGRWDPVGDASLFVDVAPGRAVGSITEPIAAGVGRRAFPLALSGRWADPFSLTPNYLRGSAAEEKITTPSR